MSDIPSADVVRETFADAFNGPARAAARVEFDRWLAGERARVWDEAVAAHRAAISRWDGVTRAVNPYREGGRVMSDELTPDTEAVTAAWVWQEWGGYSGDEYDALKAAFDRWLAGERNAAAAYALRKVVWDWRADPDAFGDNDKDYRNALLYIADLVEAG